MYVHGMNLRKWLKKHEHEHEHEHELNKAERLQKYKQIVDMAHSQGNALPVCPPFTLCLFSSYRLLGIAQHSSSSVGVEVEKSWYACPKELGRDHLLSANAYIHAVLLFESNAEFVSSVCWREKSNMIVSANSGGIIKVKKKLWHKHIKTQNNVQNIALVCE
ncbi:hypothetical protein QVD17_27799 [Tagetes erecta]|uniref:Uncharacterized protein n=1 Tax=Tagetes erecta TaxID=13708 RepID=A0AAD8NRF1_TARER|nr:hypothetical protein QVD17_27799 [Tagetes erecta]